MSSTIISCYVKPRKVFCYTWKVGYLCLVSLKEWFLNVHTKGRRQNHNVLFPLLRFQISFYLYFYSIVCPTRENAHKEMRKDSSLFNWYLVGLFLLSSKGQWWVLSFKKMTHSPKPLEEDLSFIMAWGTCSMT